MNLVAHRRVAEGVADRSASPSSKFLVLDTPSENGGSPLVSQTLAVGGVFLHGPICSFFWCEGASGEKKNNEIFHSNLQSEVYSPSSKEPLLPDSPCWLYPRAFGSGGLFL